MHRKKPEQTILETCHGPHSVWFVSPLKFLLAYFPFCFCRNALASSRAVPTFLAARVIACDAVGIKFAFPVVK
jgi:hypothetical protein